MALRGVVKHRPGAPGFRLQIGRFDIRPGDRLAIVGPSGSGKSTLIDLLALALAPDAGTSFWVADRPDPMAPAAPRRDVLAAWRSDDRATLAHLRGRLFGYVVQTGGLLPFLPVRANIVLSQRLSGRGDADWAAELAHRLGIADLLDRMPARLSVGQRQRVAVARALAHRPAILLADEPTASLDPVNAERVMDALCGLVAQAGAALVLATHDSALAGRYGFAERRIGQTVDAGGVASHLADPAVAPEAGEARP